MRMMFYLFSDILSVLLTRLLSQLLEEPLVEDERHAADLLHPSLRLALAVHQIRRDGDGQPPPEFLPLESCQHIAQMD